ncbi:MAG: stressosome-associated protein Prli42 [Sporolactobacillus sp.]|nr:stressosome-associated protein Prli42 [Sporolactobacillus sp. STSJ-5]MCQ2010023.1 stressosome-associated protein Prli42 [Sporolactobacillus sp. STSJ-5]
MINYNGQELTRKGTVISMSKKLFKVVVYLMIGALVLSSISVFIIALVN